MKFGENIEEITDLFNQIQWLIYIPFALYLGSYILNIFQMKNEIELIETIINDHVSKEKVGLLEQYDSYSFLARKNANHENLYKSLRTTIDYFGSGEFERSVNIQDEIDGTSSLIDSLYELSAPRHHFELPSLDLKSIPLQVLESHPNLKQYISVILMDQVLVSLQANLFQYNNITYCGYFFPFVQRFGNSYFIYPDKVDRYKKSMTEIKVNGSLLCDNKYTFHPKRRGLHNLDIEYSFWGNYGLQSVNFRKGLVVK